MAEPTVGAGYARGLLELAVSKGAERQALLTRSGIAAAALDDPDGRVPFDRYVTLMRAARTLTGDAALALHYGEHVDISRVSVVGLLSQAADSMLEGFLSLNRYVRLIVEADVAGGDRFSIVRDEGRLWGVDNRRNPNDFPELTESAFAQMVCGPRRLLGFSVIKSIHVTHPAPPYRDEYERVFAVPVVFDSRWNALELDEQFYTHKVALLPRYVFGILNEHAEAMLRNLEASKTTRGQVEALLMPVLHKGEAGVDAIADRMGVSRQTLFRRLKAEGVTFEKVLDELRYRLALHYLNGRKASVNETAYLVGFSEPAAFSRAFKRWTGGSPGQHRAA